MASFTDTEGKTWQIIVTVGSIKRVKRLTDYDLSKALSDGFEGLAKLIDSPIDLADVLYGLCQPEAEKTGVSDEQFGERLVGDVIHHAAVAMMEGLADFFPQHQSETLKLAIKALQTTRTETLEKLKTMDVEEILSKSATNSLASSESTPLTLRSAN